MSSGRRAWPTAAGGVAGIHVRPAHESPATRGLDVLRCRRPADPTGDRALRRSGARRRPPRPSRHRATDAARYVYPARHFASRLTDPALPRMGERLRLRRDFDISGFPPHARAVLAALKRYPACSSPTMAATGSSIAPDRRFSGLESLARVKGSDFEVIVPTGAGEDDFDSQRLTLLSSRGSPQGVERPNSTRSYVIRSTRPPPPIPCPSACEPVELITAKNRRRALL